MSRPVVIRVMASDIGTGAARRDHTLPPGAAPRNGMSGGRVASGGDATYTIGCRMTVFQRSGAARRMSLR